MSIQMIFREELGGLSHWIVDELEQLIIAINKAIDELTDAVDALDTGTVSGDIDASQIISGQVALARGANITVAALVAADIPNLDASKITSGLLALARGGTHADLSATGGATHVLRQASTGADITVGALVAADIPNLDASKITAGQLALARGGSAADLSGTGGSGQYVKQNGAGSAFTVGAILAADVPTLSLKVPKPESASSGWMNVFPNAGTANALMVGLPAVTSAGTVTETLSGALRYSTHTVSTSGSSAGLRASSAVWHYATDNPSLYLDIMTGPSIADVRFWIGMDSGQTTVDNGSNQSYACFRYSTSAGDGGWIGACSDGNSANQQLTSQVAAIAINTRYEMRISINAGVISFTINGGAAQTLNTHVPTALMGLLINLTALVNSAKAVSIRAAYFEWGV
jgi:hypothetical protein